MRVGRQPYGVLPVTTINEFTAVGNEGIDPQARATAESRARVVRDVSAGRRLRWLIGGAHCVISDARRSSSPRRRSRTRASPAENRWATLAGSLARSTRNLIADTWRTNQHQAARSTARRFRSSARSSTRATPAELAALAAALPGALQSRPLHSSVLGRMARQAALLEWSRLARGVCTRLGRRSLTAGSERDGRRASAVRSTSTCWSRRSPNTPGPLDPLPDRDVVRDLARHGRLHPGPRREDRASRRLAARRRDDDPIDRFPSPTIRPSLTILTARDRRGDVPVNTDELQRIRALVGSLAQPLASCPGATRLASFRQALTQLSAFPAARIESEMFGTLDICNHRLDAWFTSLASRRLATLRASDADRRRHRRLGMSAGRAASRSSRSATARRVHSYALAGSGGRSRGAPQRRATRAQDAGSHHADIDLSSRRVRLARWILEGIRNGRSLSELLGVRFERAVKGTAAETARSASSARCFQAFSGMGVLDGLALHQKGVPASSSADVGSRRRGTERGARCRRGRAHRRSGVSDREGNPVGALINIEAIAAGASPPELRVVETPSTGIRLTHRVVVALPANAVAPGWAPSISPRSRAEPLLDAWCGLLLGPASDTCSQSSDRTRT